MRTFSLATEEVKEEEYPSYTYAIKTDHIEGRLDGIDAVKQAVEKILNTERYEYPVYSFSYGAQLQKLVGKEQPYVRSELKRMVTEALMWDNRIKEVSGFRFYFDGDTCTCTFCVECVYGSLPGKAVVTV